MNIFLRFYYGLRLRRAAQMAEEAHEQTLNRYFVLPVSGTTKLAVVDRNNFRKLKRKHYINSNVTMMDLKAECFYATANRQGTQAMSEKTRRAKAGQYFSYVEAMRSLSKNKKRNDPHCQD